MKLISGISTHQNFPKKFSRFGLSFLGIVPITELSKLTIVQYELQAWLTKKILLLYA